MAVGKKILVIDDDSAAGYLIEQVLGKRGLDVVISRDARGGYETAVAIVPDLIFINLLLPDTNGLKLSKAIHALEELKKVPVIMFISSQGELDARYTVTIGIVDTLVKPLKAEEIIEKTKAALGASAVPEVLRETIAELPVEDAVEPLISIEEEEIPEEEALSSVIERFDETHAVEHTRGKGEAIESGTALTKEGEADMPEKKDPADNKEDAFEDKDLFSEDSDIFGEELNKSLSAMEERPSKALNDEADPGEDEDDLSSGEKPAGPLKRIMLIAASVLVGIMLGIGGYFFFTAGDKPVPGEKQVTRVLPEPADIVPAPSADKTGKVSEIPVMQEPLKSEPMKPEQMKSAPAQIKESKLPGPAKTEKKKEPAQNAEPDKAKKESAPAAATTPEEKKPAPQEQTAKKKTSAAARVKRTYYVQVGLFENEANANALVEKIGEKGFTASVKSFETAEKKTLYRVTAGTFENFKKAVQVSETLNKQGVSAIVHKQ
jgi:CheY-like chemotaxis protein/cell division septation protein DedD